MGPRALCLPPVLSAIVTRAVCTFIGHFVVLAARTYGTHTRVSHFDAVWWWAGSGAHLSCVLLFICDVNV